MAVDRSRLAAALAYRQAEEERRRRMMESVPVPGAELPTPVPSQNLRRDLENLSIGIGEGLTNQLEGVKGIVTDPVGAARGAYEGVKAVVRDPSIIADALRYTAQKVGSGPLGAGEVIGEMIGPRKTGPTMAELDVYHGTRHRFPATEANPLGEFDASKIGTGEGSQAFGHGIYLAENPQIAQEYVFHPLKNVFLNKRGDFLRERVLQKQSDSQILQDYMSAYNETFEEAVKDLQSIKKLANEFASFYKADLPDEMIDRMLDYDKPINEQSPVVLAALEKAGINTQSTALAGPMAKGQERHLAKHGIPGIKYFDAASRGDGGAGTRNFVVFPGEEKKVRILERK
jgi:hypothetical protein